MNVSSSNTKPKVLFLASDCNPQWHSLPALVAEYLRALTPYANITLVTQIRNKENLSGWLPDEVEVHFIDSEAVARPLYKFAQWITGDPNKSMTLQVALGYPSYLYFEYCVWKKFKKDLRNKVFDVVHRASPMSPTIPSFIAKRCPVPFLFGPIQGGLPWPDVFKSEMRREGEWMNYLRAAHRYMPYYQSTYAKASAILAAYKHSMDDVPQKNRDRIIEFTEGGIRPTNFPDRQFSLDDDKPAKILFVGRLVPFKQPEVLIRCVERSKLLQQQKTIIVGDGPEYLRLKKLVEELNLTESVELTGALPYREVLEQMYGADIFALPSIREQGGGVLTMASMAKTPCVVVNYGGPARRVPEGCGIQVPLGPVESIIENVTKALERLVENPDERRAMGEAAREFTEKFYDWDWKGRKTREIYDWTLGRISEKPNYWADTGVDSNKTLLEKAEQLSF